MNEESNINFEIKTKNFDFVDLHEAVDINIHDIFWKISDSSQCQKSKVFTAPGAFKDELDWSAYENGRDRISGRIGFFSLNDITFRDSGYIFKDGRLLTDPAMMLPYVAGMVSEGLRSDVRNTGNLEQQIVDRRVLILTAETPQVYGHWLLDYLPRLWLFKKFWKGTFPYILMPNTVPVWARDILIRYFNVEKEKFLFFDQQTTEVRIKNAIIPSFLHYAHEFHPLMNEFISDVVDACTKDQPKPETGSRIYISRHLQRHDSSSRRRYIRNEIDIMRLAQRHGYTVVCPEQLSWLDQVRVFSAATSIVGEDGSAMHNSIFASPGTIVATLPLANHVQISLSALRQHPTTSLPALFIKEEPDGSSYEVDLHRADQLLSNI